tara:strand:+ start:819 stop:1070 length:252 start_codon:yes stop_codon:yes gene_type:complete
VVVPQHLAVVRGEHDDRIAQQALLPHELQQATDLIVDKEQPPGAYTLQWDGRTDAGEPAGNGTYLYHLNAGEFHITRRLTLLK